MVQRWRVRLTLAESAELDQKYVLMSGSFATALIDEASNHS